MVRLLKLPDLAFDSPDERLWTITVRHLLQHSGGWDTTKSGNPMFSRETVTDPMGNVSCTAAIQKLVNRPLDFDPGSRQAYSNFGYCVLGRIIEAVSGQSYGQFVRAHLLEPAGVKDMELARTGNGWLHETEVRYHGQGLSLTAGGHLNVSYP